jgi:hypothetical protein
MILNAIGLNSLKSLGLGYSTSDLGGFVEFFADVPEAGRQGLFQVLALQAKDASPPPVIPADAMKFTRFRIDLQKTWAGLDRLLASLRPEWSGAARMILDSAGKDKDPNFDLRQELIGNLGDDIITYERIPSKIEAGLPSASMVLLGSSAPEKLANAIKIVVGSLGPQVEIKDREFLGRKIFTLPEPQAMGQTPRPMMFSAANGYVAFSRDSAILEEFLRNTESAPKPLRAVKGITEGAEKAGGTAAGVFGYSNDSEEMRVLFETLKTSGGDLNSLFTPSTLSMTQPKWTGWADFSLLPAYPAVAKYFSYTVYSGGMASDGLHFKVFTPRASNEK